MKQLLTLVIAMVFSLNLFAGDKAGADYSFIDQYLQDWDTFAQFNNGLVDSINSRTVKFKSELAKAIEDNPKKALPRAVFYAVVQVGGSYSIDSEIGKIITKQTNNKIPIHITDEKKQIYFSGDLFLWWEDQKSDFESYPLLEEWIKRDFAQETVIPIYRKNRKE
jgi:hypothetical protein